MVSVYGAKGEPTGAHVKLPAVFTAPIRTDIVSSVHMDMLKNARQPYAVSEKAGRLLRGNALVAADSLDEF